MNKFSSKVKTLPSGVLLAILFGVVSLVTAGAGAVVLGKNRAALDAQILERTKTSESEKVNPSSPPQKLATKFGQERRVVVAIISVIAAALIALTISTIQIMRYYF